MFLVTRFSKIPGINILVITRRETLSVSGQQPEALRLSNWLRTSRSQVKYFKNILESLCISLLQRQDFKVGEWAYIVISLYNFNSDRIGFIKHFLK